MGCDDGGDPAAQGQGREPESHHRPLGTGKPIISDWMMTITLYLLEPSVSVLLRSVVDDAYPFIEQEVQEQGKLRDTVQAQAITIEDLKKTINKHDRVRTAIIDS